MMDKVRVHEIAKELGINSKEVVDKAAAMGLNVKTASSSVSIEEAEQIMNYIMSGASTETTASKSSPKTPILEEAPVVTAAVAEKIQPVVVAEVKEEITEVVVPEEEAPKRSGLKIVKKKRPQEEEFVAPVRQESVNVSSYGKLSEQAQRELEAKRAKKTQGNNNNGKSLPRPKRLKIYPK